MLFMRAPILLALASLWILTGCGAHRYHEEPWTDKAWKQAQADNQQRLLIEDERKKPVSLLGPIDKLTATIGDVTVTIYNYITGNTPFNAAKNLLDPAYPDHRREAVVYLSNRSRRKQVIDLYVRALDDENDGIRLEAAKSLANMPDPSAMTPLINHLQERAGVRVSASDKMETRDENPDVRIACADALRNFRKIEAANALVRVLRDRNFGVSYQARESLKLITGKDFRYNQTAWLDYLSSQPAGF